MTRPAQQVRSGSDPGRNRPQYLETAEAGFGHSSPGAGAISGGQLDGPVHCGQLGRRVTLDRPSSQIA